MDFNLTEDQKIFRDTARDFARAELVEPARVCEVESQAPSRELIKKFAEMGFLGINVPQAYGGLGLGNLDALVVLEEFAKNLIRDCFSSIWILRGARESG